MRIRDDAVSWSSIAAAPGKEEEEEDEEAMPVVAELIDERPDEVKLMEEFRTNSKWKLLGDQNKDWQHLDISGPAKPNVRRQHHDFPEPSAPGGKHNGSLELSPLRRRRHDTPDPSPHGRRCPGTPELSNPRQQQHHNTPDPSPPRRRRPGTPDPSPPRRRRPGTPELSPPRKQQCHDTPDLSLPRKQRPGIPELSNPRQQQRHDTPDPSPPRRRCPGTPELSNPRQQHHHNTPDPSLRWQQRQDLSPRREKPGSPSGRKSRRKGRTLPAGKAQHRSWRPPEHSPRPQDAQGSPKKAHKASPGAKAGLLSADVRQREKQELRKHQRSTKELEEESQNAQTVFRDKWGRKRNLAREQLEQRLRAEAEAERKERYARWGKGLAQERQQQQRVEDAIKEMQKPLARSIHDQDLDRMLREREREGDPMAALIKKRKAKENKEKEKPRYKGRAPPPNRFNIWPGHRWDGVDRSQGLEQQHLASGANTKTVQELTHEWSIQDL